MLRTLLSLAFAVSSAQAVSPRSATVVFYDLASVGPSTTARALNAARAIYAAAGMDLSWTVGNPESPEAQAVDFTPVSGCRAGNPETLTARILPQAPPGLPSGTVGYALPCAQDGVLVTIFADRLLTETQSKSIGLAAALGCALAHELGHVLLRSGEHSRTGLMKATWTSHEWEIAARGGLRFEASQVMQIRRALAR